MPQTNFDSTELPALQPHSHCVLIPRDPNCIYAYWDYTQQDIDLARNELGVKGEEVQLILRIYDITDIDFNGSNANHTWDLDVGYINKNNYIQVWKDNADYCAQLGLSRGENHFIALMSSNVAHTPPNSSSKRNDLIWQEIKAHKESQPYIKITQVKPSKKSRIYHLTLQDIRDYYMDLFAKVSKKGRRSRSLSMEEFLKEKLKDTTWEKVCPILVCPDLLKRTHPGASMEFTGKLGASENLFKNQSEGSEGRLKARKFFFEIWTELIVHGRTESDAKVLLNQKGVKLNPDGTFSLRYALPDGAIPLKFIAQSADGIEQRHINTQVDRENTISSQKILKDSNG